MYATGGTQKYVVYKIRKYIISSVLLLYVGTWFCQWCTFVHSYFCTWRTFVHGVPLRMRTYLRYTQRTCLCYAYFCPYTYFFCHTRFASYVDLLCIVRMRPDVVVILLSTHTLSVTYFCPYVLHSSYPAYVCYISFSPWRPFVHAHFLYPFTYVHTFVIRKFFCCWRAFVHARIMYKYRCFVRDVHKSNIHTYSPYAYLLCVGTFIRTFAIRYFCPWRTFSICTFVHAYFIKHAYICYKYLLLSATYFCPYVRTLLPAYIC